MESIPRRPGLNLRRYFKVEFGEIQKETKKAPLRRAGLREFVSLEER
jgi:hypothetical protein